MLIASLLLLVAIALIAGEVGLRWADGVPLVLKASFGRERDYHPFFSANTAAAYHRTLGWTNGPNLRWGGFTTDEYGTRLPSAEARPLPLGAIVACGASYTAGAEVTDENSWPALLEGLLGSPVVNAAAGGWATDQIVLRAEQMLDLAQPSTLIAELMDGSILDAERFSYGRARKPYYVIDDGGGLVLHNSPVPLFNGVFNDVKVLRWLVDHAYLAFWLAQRLSLLRWIDPNDPGDERATPSGSGIEISVRLLERAKATADLRGVRFVLLMQYGSRELRSGARWETSERVLAGARAAGIEIVDTWARLRQVADNDPEGYRTLFIVQPDGQELGHMSAAGNRLVAEELAAALRLVPPTGGDAERCLADQANVV
jgi:hypothetical protein